MPSAVTSALEREHRSIEKVIDTILIIADDLEQGRRIDPSLLKEVTFFLRIFADQCQTAKEDDLLFPALEEKCMSPDACPIDNLRSDHTKAEVLTRELLEEADLYTSTGHASAKEPLIRTLRYLAKLYQEHIWTEDFVVLPLAEKVLSAEELGRLAMAFERIEAKIRPDEVADRIGERAKRCACHLGEIFN